MKNLKIHKKNLKFSKTCNELFDLYSPKFPEGI